MTKSEALYQFLSSFGLNAYDENSVPTGDNSPQMPYITYDVSLDNLDNEVNISPSLWYRSTSWTEISAKADEIAQRLYRLAPIKIDGGYIWIKRGSPFAQRMNDPEDDMVRRIYINLTIEYLTAY